MANLETRPAGPASDKAAIRVRFVPRTAAHRRWRTRTYTIAVGMDHDLQEVAGAARDQQPRVEPRQRRAHVLHGPAGRAAISETGGAGALLSRSTGAGAAAAPASHASRRAARISVWPSVPQAAHACRVWADWPGLSQGSALSVLAGGPLRARSHRKLVGAGSEHVVGGHAAL